MIEIFNSYSVRQATSLLDLVKESVKESEFEFELKCVKTLKTRI
jgi:hypothetical protein